jgi:hypothetical protein
MYAADGVSVVGSFHIAGANEVLLGPVPFRGEPLHDDGRSGSGETSRAVR